MATIYFEMKARNWNGFYLLWVMFQRNGAFQSLRVNTGTDLQFHFTPSYKYHWIYHWMIFLTKTYKWLVESIFYRPMGKVPLTSLHTPPKNSTVTILLKTLYDPSNSWRDMKCLNPKNHASNALMRILWKSLRLIRGCTMLDAKRARIQIKPVKKPSTRALNLAWP